jgi:hypothetical protein
VNYSAATRRGGGKRVTYDILLTHCFSILLNSMSYAGE